MLPNRVKRMSVPPFGRLHIEISAIVTAEGKFCGPSSLGRVLCTKGYAVLLSVNGGGRCWRRGPV